MTSLADRTIAALRNNHDALVAFVSALSDDDLGRTSGAAEWTVADVLSHLGSGAEIGLAGFEAWLAGGEAPGQDFNQQVWDRWNAASPRETADGCVEHNARLVAAYEQSSAAQRDEGQIKLGFLPFPLPFAAVAGMRLSEAALHGWDARVAFDPGVGLTESEAAVLLDQQAGPLNLLLGFSAKPDRLAAPAIVAVEGTGLALAIDDSAAFTPVSDEPTASFRGPVESVLRLIAGRLAPDRTPASVSVDGNVTLDDLRRVFPGY